MYKHAPSWYDLRCLKATLNPNEQTNRIELNSMKQTNVHQVIHLQQLQNDNY